jgi:peptide/nickel transport system permease protein
MGTLFRLLAPKTGRLLLTVFIILTAAFFIPRLIPGDPARVVAGLDAPPERVEAARAHLGTDKPFLVQYGKWITGVLRFDFGKSLLSGEEVSTLIMDRFPFTLLLSLAGMAIACCVALPFGILSAVKRWSLWDYAGIIFSQAGMAFPCFWLAILLLLVFSAHLEIFPLSGGETLSGFVLPVLALGIHHTAILLRTVRKFVTEELGKEYIITAVSKGLPDNIVRYRHVIRNALLPLISFSGIQFGYMLGSSIIVEQLFALPGLGRLILSAIYQRDFPVMQGGVVFTAVVFCCVNFLTDVLYSYINPRIRVS